MLYMLNTLQFCQLYPYKVLKKKKRVLKNICKYIVQRTPCTQKYITGVNSDLSRLCMENNEIILNTKLINYK